MNVKELKELLNNFPDGMEVVVWDEDSFCDYRRINTAEIVTGILKDEFIWNPYILLPEHKDLVQPCLFIGY